MISACAAIAFFFFFILIKSQIKDLPGDFGLCFNYLNRPFVRRFVGMWAAWNLEGGNSDTCFPSRVVLGLIWVTLIKHFRISLSLTQWYNLCILMVKVYVQSWFNIFVQIKDENSIKLEKGKRKVTTRR